MIAIALYNLVDTIFVGWGVGPLAIGALTIAFPIQMLIVAIAQTVGIGAGSAISRSLGAKKYERVKRVVGNSFLSIFLLSLTFACLGLFFTEEILIFFGSTETILSFAKDYMTIIFAGLIFFAFAVSSNNLIRAEGNARVAMISMLIGAFLNMGLDPIFIFGLKMGIKGAALATVIAQFTSFLYVLHYIYTQDTPLKISLIHLKPYPDIIKEIFKVGSPSFARLVSSSFATLIVNQSLRFYGGDLAIIIMGVVIKVSRFLFMPLFGVVQGMLPIAGYNYGAKKYNRVFKVLKLTIKVLTFISTAGCVIILLWPNKIIGLFTNNVEVISTGIPILRIMLFSIPVLSIQIAGGSLFQALGKARPAMVLSLLRRVLIFIPLVLILPRILSLGLLGIWISYPLADIFSAFITWIFLSNQLKKMHREVGGEF